MSYRIVSSMVGLRGAAIASLAAVLLLGGCTRNSLIQGRCNKSSDCAGGLVCDNDGTCVPSSASSSPCSQDAQCGSGYNCDNLGWCVCQNQNAPSGQACSSGAGPIYRGVETDGGMPGGAGGAAGAAGSGGAGGKGDGGTNVGGSGGFVCHANTDCLTGKAICADGGVCVECTADSQCTTPTKPVCDKTTDTCRECKADSECASGPGVCMFQSDGHCATDMETVYVLAKANPTDCPQITATNAGSATLPLCTVSQGVAASSTKSLIVVRGPLNFTESVTISNLPSLAIVGQDIATIIAPSGQPGFDVSGTDIYIRGLKITTVNPATIGIVADKNATIHLDGVDIEGMPQGGLRVTASGYDVINSIFANNGGTKDDGNRFIGGAWLLDAAPPAGQMAVFAFNTVVSNKETGVVCGGTSQTIDASLLAQNLADYNGCTLSTSKVLGTGDPMLNSSFRATATSPCTDFVTAPPAGAPDHDVDGVSRPQGVRFDCGASEYKAP